MTPPFATSLLTVARTFVVVFPGTVRESASAATTIAGTLTAAPARAGGSATEVAVMVTCRSVAGGGGAVYVVATPLAVETGETVPQNSAGQDTAHFTPLLLASLVVVAVKVVTSLASTVFEAAMTLIATDGTVIVAELDFVPSATEVAVSATARSCAGGSLGGVYVTTTPLAEEAGETVPHGALGQDTVQFTPARPVSLATFAKNPAVPPIWTVADAGDIATLIAGGDVEFDPPQPAIATPSPTHTTQLRKNARRFMDHLPLHVPVRDRR